MQDRVVAPPGAMTATKSHVPLPLETNGVTPARDGMMADAPTALQHPASTCMFVRDVEAAPTPLTGVMHSTNNHSLSNCWEKRPRYAWELVWG